MKVEWKKLGDLGPYFGGLTGKTKEDFVEGNAKFITYMNVFANPSLDISSTGVVRINEGEKQNKIQRGDVLFTGSSETPDEAGMSCVVTEDLNEDYYMNSFCFGIRLENPNQYCLGYLKHILRSSDIRKAISKSASGVTRFNISKARFSKIKIPFPSLSEQQRIVEQLDTFTASIENLKEQIAQRRKQYEYYRDQLLDLEGKEGVEVKMLGELCKKITDGSHNPPKGVELSNFMMISSQNVYDGYIDLSSVKYLTEEDFLREDKRTKAKKGDVILTIVGTIGRCCVLNGDEGNITFQRSVALLRPKDDILSSYLMYYLIKNNKLLNAKANGGAQKGIYLKQLSNLLVSYYPLAEQQRIVSILDTFEASIQNLEAQLEQRQKQYEYYRNKLLTFE